MRRLKLRYLGSYSGHGAEVTQKNPVLEVEEEKAKALLATGYFDDLGGTALAKGPAPDPAPAPEPPAPGTVTTASLPPRSGTQAPAGARPQPVRRPAATSGRGGTRH